MCSGTEARNSGLNRTQQPSAGASQDEACGNRLWTRDCYLSGASQRSGAHNDPRQAPPQARPLVRVCPPGASWRVLLQLCRRWGLRRLCAAGAAPPPQRLRPRSPASCVCELLKALKAPPCMPTWHQQQANRISAYHQAETLQAYAADDGSSLVCLPAPGPRNPRLPARPARARTAAAPARLPRPASCPRCAALPPACAWAPAWGLRRAAGHWSPVAANRQCGDLHMRFDLFCERGGHLGLLSVRRAVQRRIITSGL